MCSCSRSVATSHDGLTDASNSITNLAFSLTCRGSRLVFSGASGSTAVVPCKSRIGIKFLLFPLTLCSQLWGSSFGLSLTAGINMAGRSDKNEAFLHLSLLPRLLVDGLTGIGSARGHIPSHQATNERCSCKRTSSCFFRVNMVRNLKSRFGGLCTWVCVATRPHCVQVQMSDMAVDAPQLLHLFSSV